MSTLTDALVFGLTILACGLAVAAAPVAVLALVYAVAFTVATRVEARRRHINRDVTARIEAASKVSQR